MKHKVILNSWGTIWNLESGWLLDGSNSPYISVLLLEKFWVLTLLTALAYDRQRRMNSVKRNLYWKQIKKGWSSSWKVWQFHLLGLFQPTQQSQLHIIPGQARWQCILAIVWFQCGIIYLHRSVIHLVIMNFGPLLLRCFIKYLDNLDAFIYIYWQSYCLLAIYLSALFQLPDLGWLVASLCQNC